MLSPAMEFQLELWGGLFYLLNKIFLSLMERAQDKKSEVLFQRMAWAVYIIGLPPFVAMFALKQNWIAASVELGGLPSMVLGLGLSFLNKKEERDKPRQWVNVLNWTAIISSVATGLSYSWMKFGGISSVTQMLEIGLTVGFLVGTYQIAWRRPSGYYWFMLMNGSCAVLMYKNDYLIVAIQQVLSFGFIFDAMMIESRRRSPSS